MVLNSNSTTTILCGTSHPPKNHHQHQRRTAPNMFVRQAAVHLAQAKLLLERAIRATGDDMRLQIFSDALGAAVFMLQREASHVQNG
jgi:hypothetical protein